MNLYEQYLTTKSLKSIEDRIEIMNEIIRQHPKLMDNIETKIDSCYGTHIVYLVYMKVNGVDTVYIWFKKNGTNVPRSNTAVAVLRQAGGGGRAVAAWNYVDNLVANDYLEIIWQSNDTAMQLAADPATGNLPAIPSVIATLTQVS